ncbi:MAG TPA: glutathione synthetase [Methylomirabilota bacterium]|nr:glutathione synthetase [Methylomirabilota bacterium]
MTGVPIVLATCAAWPEVSASDARLAAALEARGRRVTAAPWNGPFAPFAEAAAVVIRSTWDYHEAPGDYLAWLARLDAARTLNPPSLVRWNLSKAHVLDLGARGVRVPRSLEAEATPVALAGALARLGLDEAVIKPLIGGSGFGVERVRRGDEAAALGRALAHKPTERLLVQEWLPGIERGELAGVFFDGVFSHGLRRVPAAGEFRVNSQYGGTMEAAALEPAVVRAMTDVLAQLPTRPLYARVDGLVHDAGFTLMEVEVNDPGLGLDLVGGAADRFADALLARLAAPAVL